MVLNTDQYPSPQMLRDAVMGGRVAEYRGYVIGVRVNGVLVSDPEWRGPASEITYDVLPVDTNHEFNQETITDIRPHNRRPQNVLVQACKVGDFVRLIRFDEGTPAPFAMHLYVRTEHEIYIRCNGSQVPP